MIANRNLSKKVLTILKITATIQIEQMFGEAFGTKGMGMLGKNEIELIKMIRENDNPDNALLIATQVILEFLKLHGSSAEQVAVCPRSLG